jgi:hypothetical protein
MTDMLITGTREFPSFHPLTLQIRKHYTNIHAGTYLGEFHYNSGHYYSSVGTYIDIVFTSGCLVDNSIGPLRGRRRREGEKREGKRRGGRGRGRGRGR